MKTNLKAKLIQNLSNKKKGDEGFTLIELLVVIIIIGILSAIALPSFLNQANKARQSEAKNVVGSMNRAQQAYYLENNNEFATEVLNLALGIQTSSDNYVYEIVGKTPSEFVTNKARSKSKGLKSYAGVTYTKDQTSNGVTESITLASMCESQTPSVKAVAAGETVGEGKADGTCPTSPKMKSIK